ncbi:hypothetical protein CHELA20_50351 [Hyphomicrobiales bacterium]|nr:hypothetical protein CHELA20_50351 [Hyphomicrobiales bacterium]
MRPSATVDHEFGRGRHFPPFSHRSFVRFSANKDLLIIKGRGFAPVMRPLQRPPLMGML